MAKKTTKELSELIPSKIESHGHNGNLTIIKRSNSKFLAYYPFEEKKEIPTARGKTIHSCLKNMYNELVTKEIIHEEKKKKKRKKRNKKSPLKGKKMCPKKRRELKLKIQNKNLKLK